MNHHHTQMLYPTMSLDLLMANLDINHDLYASGI